MLKADPFGYITSTRGVDLKTGLLQYVEEKKPRFGAVVRNICPAPPGMKDWTPSAFSAKTGLIYIPHNNLCYDVEETQANYIGALAGNRRSVTKIDHRYRQLIFPHNY